MLPPDLTELSREHFLLLFDEREQSLWSLTHQLLNLSEALLATLLVLFLVFFLQSLLFNFFTNLISFKFSKGKQKCFEKATQQSSLSSCEVVQSPLWALTSTVLLVASLNCDQWIGKKNLTRSLQDFFFGRKQSYSKIKKSGKVLKYCRFTIGQSIVDVIYRHEFMPIINCFMPNSKANYFYSVYKNTVQPSFCPFTSLLICGNTQKLKSCNN